MPDYLGSMTQCEDPVNTRILSAINQAVTSGFQKIYLVSEKTKISISLKVSVETAVIELNALNGELLESAMVCGEDSLLISAST